MRAILSGENYSRYALEAILIVFSVLLALFLDSTLEDRREARNINELIGHVAAKCKATSPSSMSGCLTIAVSSTRSIAISPQASCDKAC